MSNSPEATRDIVFLSKATPGDDAFARWLAPRLEAAGYRVFADILDLETGDRWRKVLTSTLHDRAIKMLLCCSDETLNRQGVQEEIGIAEDLSKELGDPNFILPLKLKRFKKLFGIGGLQYIDFEDRWAGGLQELFEALEKQSVPKVTEGTIQPQWEQHQRRGQVVIEHSPEVLTSNWLRLVSVPDELFYLEPVNPFQHSTLLKLGKTFAFPAVPFMRGFLTFASTSDLAGHFSAIGPFKITHTFDLKTLMEEGSESPSVDPFDARNKIVDLLRQAWEKLCLERGFLSYEYSKGTGFHASESLVGVGKRISWGRQGERRSSMLRNKARGKVWEYGVSVIPSLFPYPHLRLKSRVLFSELEAQNRLRLITDPKKQHQLRRTICSGWRNKAWHGRVMAFMELLAGDSPYVTMPVGSGHNILADAMPIMFTSPVTAIQTNDADEDAEERDESTLGVYVEDEES